jgi:hypothetical protein
MANVQVSVRLNSVQLKRARKALAAKSISETLQKALDLVTEKAAHDQVIRRYSAVGTADAFGKN